LPGAIPCIGSAVINDSNGIATFNLRGLGSSRSLVLLNSRRVVALGTGVSDLNILPVALLERSEVLTGGASIGFPIVNSRFNPAKGTIAAGQSDFNVNSLNIFQASSHRFTMPWVVVLPQRSV
jgi:TonB-dependent Receptor Plug Domain